MVYLRTKLSTFFPGVDDTQMPDTLLVLLVYRVLPLRSDAAGY
jgi:hypothetical protein